MRSTSGIENPVEKLAEQNQLIQESVEKALIQKKLQDLEAENQAKKEIVENQKDAIREKMDFLRSQ